MSTRAVPAGLVGLSNLLIGGLALASGAAVLYGALSLASNPGWGWALISIFGVLLLLLLAAMAAPREWRVVSAFTLVAILGGLFFANLYLVFDGDRQYVDRAAKARELGVPFDERTRHEVVGSLRAEGVDAYPSFHASAFLQGGIEEQFGGFLPLGGISRVPTVFCNESGEYAIYESDRFGQNNDDRLYDAPGPLEMMLIGDSFAHGACVPAGQDAAGQLRAMGYKAATFGMSGNGPLLALASLAEYGPVLQPRMVLWLYYNGNDLSDLRVERENPTLLRYLEGHSHGLANRQRELDAVLARFVDAEFVRHADEQLREREQGNLAWMSSAKLRLKRILSLYEVRRLFRLQRDAYFSAAEENQADLRLFARTLQRMKELTESWGGRFYLVYVPEWETFAMGPSPLRPAVLRQVRALGIPVIDFQRTLAAQRDPLDLYPFRIQSHFKPEGYRLLAEQIVAETAEGELQSMRQRLQAAPGAGDSGS